MKYVLEPDNRNCPDEVLLGDLALVAKRLGRLSLTKAAYNSHGRFSAATMQKRFGSWNDALQLSGLAVTKRNSIPNTELLEDLRRVSAALGTTTVSVQSYCSIGSFSSASFVRAFGSWPSALKAAGLEVSSSWHEKSSDEELHENLAIVWETLGRQPKKSDLLPPLSRVSAHTYVRRFGSWRRALELFVDTANEPSPSRVLKPAVALPTTQAPQAARVTQRDPSWRLRFLVNRRDRFCCRACGRSPATHVGVVLHVDHVIPWSKGGETTMENLQTLCEQCNIGKSDLPMDVDPS